MAKSHLRPDASSAHPGWSHSHSSTPWRHLRPRGRCDAHTAPLVTQLDWAVSPQGAYFLFSWFGLLLAGLRQIQVAFADRSVGKQRSLEACWQQCRPASGKERKGERMERGKEDCLARTFNVPLLFYVPVTWWQKGLKWVKLLCFGNSSWGSRKQGTGGRARGTQGASLWVRGAAGWRAGPGKAQLPRGRRGEASQCSAVILPGTWSS